MTGETGPRDLGSWANPVEHIGIDDYEMRLTGPLQGFGKMWQKTFTIELGAEQVPEEVIAVWKANYGSFWPEKNHFYAPMSGIRPGEIAAIGTKQGPVRLSTGVLVMYADDVSFAYMTPEGHPFAGWITFSAERDSEKATVARVQMMLRPSDPLYELAFTFGVSRMENQMWQDTLRSLATHFGVTAEPETSIACLDKRRQWKEFGQIRRNSMIRTTLTAPFRGRARKTRSEKV